MLPSRRIPLTLGALGVVFGDIGTSPLYALRECFRGVESLPITESNVLGILSTIFWSLTLIVSLKYLFFLLKADNNGEGGVFALHALLMRGSPTKWKGRKWVLLLTLVGASLLFSDGMITPAISVLSAVEGLGVYSSHLQSLVIPVSAVILFFLFRLQRLGTGKVSGMFGPVMLLWFFSIAAFGIAAIIQTPLVLKAFHPLYAFQFFSSHKWEAIPVLGAVFLALTGAEALYADLGHFGAGPIRKAWFFIVKPALLLNYFGQGAHLLRHLESTSPFYDMLPPPLLVPMITLATLATIIASQALISGAFSLTHQAVQLGYLPRIRILHTSSELKGQIYIPFINWFLAAGVLLLVFFFGSSSALSHAYGIAISADMVITTILFFQILRWILKIPMGVTVAFCGVLLVVEGMFFLSNSTKIFHGGFVPIALTLGFMYLMNTWKKGREILRERLRGTLVDLEGFVAQLRRGSALPSVPGTAIFLNSLPDKAPPALLHHIKHIPVLHERIILLTIQVENEIPHISSKERIFSCEDLGMGFFRVVAQYGFMDRADVEEIIRILSRHYGLELDPYKVSFFLGRESLLTTGRSKLSRAEKVLFAFLSRNAVSASSFFGIPPGRVVEMGMQIEI